MWFWLGGLWLLLVLAPLVGRPLLPVDETRYVAVAWEMWVRGEWLVPYLNGEVYHHKPPLLFWLIHLGWWLFGVNEWWPRLVPGLFSLGGVWLTFYLARLLWPGEVDIARWAPLILLSCLLWSLFTSAMMFDMLLSFWVLFGMVALLRERWWLLGVAVGLGILSKGPVMLLHVLPVALLASWWRGGMVGKSWYFGVLGGMVLGVLIALVWAVPAGLVGGEGFREAIFWGQTAGRLVSSFAHEHPVWWYLPWLPVALFPWLWWLPWWRGLLGLSEHWGEVGVRFCVAWLVLVLVSFSLVSGKQLHYLLPVLPAFALLTAFLVVRSPRMQWCGCWDNLLPALVLILVGIWFSLASYWSIFESLPLWMTRISPWSGWLLILMGVGLMVWLLSSVRSRLWSLSVAAVLFSLVFPLSIVGAGGRAYDLREVSQYIHSLQKSNSVLVHFGDYHGQYQFLGRLDRPLQVVDEYEVCPWLIKHLEGKLVVYLSDRYQKLGRQADYVQPYRSKQVGIIGAAFVYGACLKMMPLL